MREDEQGFLDAHHARWAHSLFLARVFLNASTEFGQLTNEEERPGAAERGDALFEALIRNHARAIRVGREIYVLAANGYSDGALAQWRTLHEIAIVCLLLADQPRTMSEQYLLYDVAESQRAARSHVEHAPDLNCVVPTPEEMMALDEHVEAAREEYGARFGRNLEWARSAFPDRPHRQPITIVDVERLVGLAHWRPRYGMASQAVHASPKGAYWSLGVGRMDSHLVAGPASEGLAEALHPLFISLNQVSSCLAVAFPTEERVQLVQALGVLSERAGDALLAEHAKGAPNCEEGRD